ncbi:CBS domain-containing protein [Sorangium sp. So ce327]|jgi:CBS domain-containing protein|uniref:CBS domain-containing protein n=1 Tax=unclassified Sorangium TaxID=2621164 RepID=UPI003F635689
MKPKKNCRVEDYMSTAVITLKEADTISAANLEMKLAEIRHIPVVDAKGHVVGIVSDRDLLRHVSRLDGKPIPIESIMTRRVRTVRATTPAADAAQILLDHKIGCLPVVGDEEQLVGIITETDFLSIAQQALRGIDVTHGAGDR